MRSGDCWTREQQRLVAVDQSSARSVLCFYHRGCPVVRLFSPHAQGTTTDQEETTTGWTCGIPGGKFFQGYYEQYRVKRRGSWEEELWLFEQFGYHDVTRTSFVSIHPTFRTFSYRHCNGLRQCWVAIFFDLLSPWVIKAKVKVEVYSLVSNAKRHSPDFTQLSPGHRTCSFISHLNFPGSIYRPAAISGTRIALFQHTSLHCPTRYPLTPRSRECTCGQSALPRSTTSEHNSAQPGIEPEISHL